MSLALRDTTHIPNNNGNDTPPHTSKRPTPRASGVFFGRVAANMSVWTRNDTTGSAAATARGSGDREKGRGSLGAPHEISLAVPDGMYHSARCEISWGPR